MKEDDWAEKTEREGIGGKEKNERRRGKERREE